MLVFVHVECHWEQDNCILPKKIAALSVRLKLCKWCLLKYYFKRIKQFKERMIAIWISYKNIGLADKQAIGIKYMYCFH